MVTALESTRDLQILNEWCGFLLDQLRNGLTWLQGLVWVADGVMAIGRAIVGSGAKASGEGRCEPLQSTAFLKTL